MGTPDGTAASAALVAHPIRFFAPHAIRILKLRVSAGLLTHQAPSRCRRCRWMSLSGGNAAVAIQLVRRLSSERGAAQLVVGRGVYMGRMDRLAADDEPALEIENGEVRCWRHDQFVLLGFSDAQALLLADSEADLGQARYLVECGCTLTLVLQILL
jgi:hypothetical protein